MLPHKFRYYKDGIGSSAGARKTLIAGTPLPAYAF